jgi:hypothetical protein
MNSALAGTEARTSADPAEVFNTEPYTSPAPIDHFCRGGVA